MKYFVFYQLIFCGKYQGGYTAYIPNETNANLLKSLLVKFLFDILIQFYVLSILGSLLCWEKMINTKILDFFFRTEGLDEARWKDTQAAEAWIGHPYVDIIDNGRYNS